MPGVSFLFWNVNQKSLEHRIGRLAIAHTVDVVTLAECPTPSEVVIAALATAGAGRFHEAENSGDRLRVFSRLPRRMLRFQFIDPNQRWLLYRAVLKSAPDFILAVAHLPSKVNIRDATQSLVAESLAADIARTEDRWGHRRTLLVGDLK